MELWDLIVVQLGFGLALVQSFIWPSQMQSIFTLWDDSKPLGALRKILWFESEVSRSLLLGMHVLYLGALFWVFPNWGRCSKLWTFRRWALAGGSWSWAAGLWRFQVCVSCCFLDCCSVGFVYWDAFTMIDWNSLKPWAQISLSSQSCFYRIFCHRKGKMSHIENNLAGCGVTLL